jgi:hypothetical protein
MPLIDRSMFQPDPQFGGLNGCFAAGRWRFDCGLYTKANDLERAWATCEALVGLLVDRFDEVERAVGVFAPTLNHWTEEDVTPAELARRMLEAMERTQTVALSVGDAGRGSAYFDGPDYVLGHAVEVVAREDGRLVRVGIAG